MSKYYPDKWVIVRISSPDHPTIDKVVGSWYGGYGGSNSWRMNSGIQHIITREGGYDIIGYSGSVCSCPKDTEGMSFYTNTVVNSMIAELEKANLGTMKVITIQEAIDGLEMPTTQSN